MKFKFIVIVVVLFYFPTLSNAEIMLRPSFNALEKATNENGVSAYSKKDQGWVLTPDIGSPDQVLVIVNQNSKVSMAIGNYYIELRGIPEINLCTISCSKDEIIQRAEYTGTIAFSVKEYIEKNGLKDRIKYLVTTTGVPLKIDGIEYYNTCMAAVDSDLTLLDYEYIVKDWLPNPYYGFDRNLDRTTMPLYLVNRLTAYNIDEDGDNIPDDVKSFLQKSLFPPEHMGRFIFDVDPTRDDGDGYQNGNDWMREAADTLTKMGAEVVLDETTNFLVEEHNVIGYCSWGSNDNNRKNHGEPYFTWTDGAIAATHVSTNGRTFIYPPQYGQSMEADMFREGITGVYGNVYEPFLYACSHPEILFPRYYKGYNLAESYYMSFNYISWMEVVVGDPLCAPFAPKMARVYITTNNVIYNPGDMLKVDVDIWNTGEHVRARLYVPLKIGDNLFFYPDWTNKISYQRISFNERSRTHIDIIDIQLPEPNEQNDLTFYAVITDEEGSIIGQESTANFKIARDIVPSKQ
jgi:uncharacterized protein (TIGR03790 family)